MTTHGFDLGSLDLASGLAHDDGYTLSVLGDGATFGSSQAVVREIVSQLADGSRVVYDRAGNRVVEFDVLIEGADGAALQAGEVALRRELYRPNTATWTPPADFSAPTVFEVVASEMSPQFSDLDELRRQRKFRVSLTCAPFARSLNATTVSAIAVPVTPTTATITTADTTTGFSATRAQYSFDASGSITHVPLVVTDEGAFARASYTGTFPWVTVRYDPVSPISMATTPYLLVEMGGDPPRSFELCFGGPFVPMAPVMSRATTSGTTIHAFDCTGHGSLTAFRAEFGTLGLPGTVTLDIHNISRTDTLPQVTTRQASRTVSVGGTERTPCSIAVVSQGVNLSHTLVGTWPEKPGGFSPSMRRWRTAGNTITADSAAISDAREPIGPVAVNFTVPATSIPAGVYQIVARLRTTGGTGPLNVYWEVGTIVEGVTLQGVVSDSVDVVFPVANEWLITDLGIVTLPVIASTAGDLGMGIYGTSGVLYDEVWLMPVGDDCALTIVDAPGSSRLWLDSADITSPVPRVRIGNTDTRSNAHSPGMSLKAMGAHTMIPDATTIFVASLTENPLVSASYHKRWHSNAAEY